MEDDSLYSALTKDIPHTTAPIMKRDPDFNAPDPENMLQMEQTVELPLSLLAKLGEALSTLEHYYPGILPSKTTLR